MSEADVEYYRRRAAAELELAQQSTLPAAVAAHYQIASAYLERLPPHEREQAKVHAEAGRAEA